MTVTAEEMTSEDLMWLWAREGWRYRGIGRRPKKEQDWYAERVRYEMGLIIEKDFCDVFLVVSDAIRWAKDHGILVGPGRGSVAASVVAWLLRIHEVDPLRHPGMLFERFLDSSRADPPDIDTDFEDERRHEVFEYVEQKYSIECVGKVGNFIRYRGRNGLVDVARVYQVPTWAKEIVANLLVERSGGDSRFSATIADTVAMFPAAAKVFEDYPDLWKAALLEGNVRGMSVHAAGLVVANSPLEDFCAVYERDGVRVMSIDKYDVEYAGAIKLDFLGLSTMSVLARCLRYIGMSLEELYSLPLDDEETLQGFRDVDVVGVFQFEGRATRLVTRDVYPENFADLADVNALSRPGPLFSGTTAAYVEVRHGRRRAESLHPLVDAVTRRTRGQIIYQEQILQILRDMGGFDWFSVGQIRRIISKKMGEAAFQMSEEKFQEGALRLHGVEYRLSDRIWKLMVTSGTYSFVIAHAISYTLLGYWCMWLKQHYPVEFYAAALAKAGDEEAQFKLMKDAIDHGIEVHAPRLVGPKRAAEYGSLATWRPAPDGLVAGWRQVPGIGEKMATRIEPVGLTAADWPELLAIPGVGPKKIQVMQGFASDPDPFRLHEAEERLRCVRKWLKSQTRIPRPTHTGAEVAAIPVKEEYGAAARKRSYGKGPRVIYMGIVKARNMQDAVENKRSRTGEEAEDILRTMKRPDLLEYCSIQCYDDTGEEVYLRVNRFKMPQVKRQVESIVIGRDVVVCVGNRIAGFGTPVMVDKLYVIDPD